ncbi:hypothetical protein GCM10022409_48520 [Hymenobacter glaciei]|uniref:Uncharacterized protein n=1 Tax=Hymenobacter glaciei TaxID=877209 RepID=A0ABP7UYG5_9BACT
MKSLLAKDVLYKSDKEFNLVDASVSHSELLLRSDKIGNEDGFNIDIIFSGVEYLQMPSLLNGLSIYRDSEKKFGYKKVDWMLGKKLASVFNIKSGGDDYYIVAFDFIVFQNKLAFGESSLGVIQNKGREKEIARSHKSN